MKEVIIGVLVVVLGFAFLFPVMERYSQSFMFVDENEHIVIGKLMNQGNKLYRDLSTNHQPIPYIFSANLQKFTPINSVYLALKRHREVVFLWSFLWALVLFFRFKTKVILPLLLFESSKYLLLGNEFLAESLAVYPFAYVVGVLGEQYLNKLSKRDDLLVGVSAALATFLSVTLIVPVGVGSLLYYLKRKLPWRQMGWFGLGFTIVVLGVFAYVNPGDYFRETIVNNLLYAIPRLAKINSASDWWRLVGLPFLSFGNREVISYLIQLSTMVMIAGVIWALVKKKWSLIKGAVVLFLLWQLTNTRDIYPLGYFYDGFHLLPWLLAGLLAAAFIFEAIWQQTKRVERTIMAMAIIFWLVLIFGHKGMPIHAKPDPITEHYIQFTPLSQTTQVLNIISTPGDTLIVHPADSVIHWMSNLPPADKQISYYEWQFFPPANQRRYQNLITNNPPAFILFQNDNSAYTPSLTELLAERYRRIFTFYRGSEATGLYVLDNKWEAITVEQWEKLRASQLPIEGDSRQ